MLTGIDPEIDETEDQDQHHKEAAFQLSRAVEIGNPKSYGEKEQAEISAFYGSG